MRLNCPFIQSKYNECFPLHELSNCSFQTELSKMTKLGFRAITMLAELQSAKGHWMLRILKSQVQKFADCVCPDEINLILITANFVIKCDYSSAAPGRIMHRDILEKWFGIQSLESHSSAQESWTSSMPSVHCPLLVWIVASNLLFSIALFLGQ